MRGKAELSQEALATALGTKQSRISQLESGNYDGWSVRMLRKVAAFFDVALSVRFDSFTTVLTDIKQAGADTLVPATYVATKTVRAQTFARSASSRVVLPPTAAPQETPSLEGTFVYPTPQLLSPELETANENLALAA
jgi:transcriptional regulator with XRE-family HTH domain